MPRNPFSYTTNFIDSCAFDPKMEPEKSASREIFRIDEERHYSLLQIPHSVLSEIEHPNTPQYVKRKAQYSISTAEVQLTVDEISRRSMIANVLAGNGKAKNIQKDANHIFEAHKYCSYYFITCDNRILKKAEELYKICNVKKILKPSEFLSILKKYLNEETNHKANLHVAENVHGKQKLQEDTKLKYISYKGYIIRPSPYQLAESGEWAIHVYIEKHTDNAVISKYFIASNEFKTKEEAVKNCISYGMQIIDGKYPNCSVSDL